MNLEIGSERVNSQLGNNWHTMDIIDGKNIELLTKTRGYDH